MEEDVRGFFAPVHRALTEPILLGGAPRTVAIANGTLRRGYLAGSGSPVCHLGDRAFRGRGRRSATRSSSTLLRHLRYRAWTCEVRHAEPAEYRKECAARQFLPWAALSRRASS